MLANEFQARLKQAGFYSGTVDGIWGPQTEKAVRNWFLSKKPLPELSHAPGFTKGAFYSTIRNEIGPLNDSQVEGLERVLAEWEKRRLQGFSIQKAAAVLATAWWETNQTMQPVREAYWLSEAWRKRNLRYYPYYGRGTVQLTWDYNYKRAGEKYGLPLVEQPDLALDPDLAVQIMFDGMDEGWFTSKKLDDYIDEIDESDAEDLKEYIESRRVVNGTDKALEIGRLALVFERALKAGE